MHRLRTPSILGAMLAGALALTSAPALAEVSIAVGPALLELEGRPGDTGRITITVSENGSDPVDVVTGLSELTGVVGDHSAVGWSSVTPARASLRPGEDVTVEYVVQIPDDAVAGGRYATVTITTAPPGPATSPDGNAPVMLGRIEVPVFLTVRGEEGLARRPISIERTALFLGQDGAATVVADVRNDGNVHVPLSGRALLTEAPAAPALTSPQPVGESTFPLGRVLPGTTRTLVAGETLAVTPGGTFDLTVGMGSPDEGDPTRVGKIIAQDTRSIIATGSLSIDGITVCATPDGGHLVTTSLVNDGGLGLTPDVRLAVLSGDGAAVATARVSVQALAWPGSTVTALALIPAGMPDGSWSLVATATYGQGSTTDLSVPFVTGGDPLSSPACPMPTPTAPSAPAASSSGEAVR